MSTWNNFFKKEARKELIGLVIGLISVLTFANVMMPEWQWLFFIAIMILSSSVYRFIMVNENFYKKQNLTDEKLRRFIVEKNAFVIFFLLVILVPVIVLSSIFNQEVISNNFIFKILTYTFIALGTENIIYIFHNKPVEGYAGGFKRNEMEDIMVGIKNVIDQIPSLVCILLFSLLFFVMELNISIYFSILYYLFGIVTFICFKKEIK